VALPRRQRVTADRPRLFHGQEREPGPVPALEVAMVARTRVFWPAVMLALLIPACDKSTPPTETQSAPDLDQEIVNAAEESGARTPFDEAQVFFEFNTTDNDLGFQLFLDAEGWEKVTLAGPSGEQLLRIVADGNLANLGLTELRFESAEPSPDEVLNKFPAGEYKLRGTTVDGQTLFSRVTLSHDFLAPPSISPSNGQEVDPDNTVVTWSAPGAEQVEIIIELEDLGEVLDVTVPGTTHRLRVPRQFLRRGTEYKIEILSIGENGNRIIAESTFKTAQ
jgi:hypothetical protein